jgi:hypothetical protein
VVALEIEDVLRTGSSCPVRVVTDEGRFVVKLIGGAEGPRALASEWIATGLAGALGLPSLERRPVWLGPELARGLLDSELREHVERGAGECLGLRWLPLAAPATQRELAAADDDFALRVLWLDSLVQNPDRRSANPNVLRLGSSLLPIDHAAALPFHHTWSLSEAAPGEGPTCDAAHVFADRLPRLLPRSGEFAELTPRELIEAECLGLPESWLGEIVFETPERQKLAYAAWLWKRLRALRVQGRAALA